MILTSLLRLPSTANLPDVTVIDFLVFEYYYSRNFGGNLD